VGAIAGGTVGGVFGLVALVVLLLFFLRRRRTTSNPVDRSEAPNHEIEPFIPERMLREEGPPRAQVIRNEKGRARTDISSQTNGSDRTQDTPSHYPRITPSSSATGPVQYHSSSAPDSIAVTEIRTLVQEISTVLRGLHTYNADELGSAPPQYMEGPSQR
jgi:MYXO-CTERM domain-containing protein